MTPDLPFARVSLPPFTIYQEAWARIRDRYWLFMGISLVGMLLGGLAPMGLMLGPMMVGIYLCLRAQAKGQPVAFDLLFKGFDRFVEAFIAALIMMAASLVVVLPLVFVVIFGAIFGAAGMAAAASSTRGPAGAGLAAGSCLLYAGALAFMMLASLLVNLFFTLAFPLIADRGVSGLDAVKLSARAALANLGPLVGLALVTFLLSFVGLCLCYIGAFLVMPLTFSAHWIVYERIFGMAEEPGLPVDPTERFRQGIAPPG
jgi:uncharacterized membrane protein